MKSVRFLLEKGSGILPDNIKNHQRLTSALKQGAGILPDKSKNQQNLTSILKGPKQTASAAKPAAAKPVAVKPAQQKAAKPQVKNAVVSGKQTTTPAQQVTVVPANTVAQTTPKQDPLGDEFDYAEFLARKFGSAPDAQKLAKCAVNNSEADYDAFLRESRDPLEAAILKQAAIAIQADHDKWLANEAEYEAETCGELLATGSCNNQCSTVMLHDSSWVDAADRAASVSTLYALKQQIRDKRTPVQPSAPVAPQAWYQGLDNAVVEKVKDTPLPLAVINKPINKQPPKFVEDRKANAVKGYHLRKWGKLAEFGDKVRTTITSVVKNDVATANRFAALQDLVPDMGPIVDTSSRYLKQAAKLEEKTGSTFPPGYAANQQAANIEDDIAVPENVSNAFNLVPIGSPAKARAIRDKKSRRAYTELTYYLKCKHFMHTRDPHFVRTLVQDARGWMLRNKFGMNTYAHYAILVSSVSAAFFVDQEELNFRQRMKNTEEWRMLEKINQYNVGDLGYRWLSPVTKLKNLRHLGLSNVKLPVNKSLSA